MGMCMRGRGSARVYASLTTNLAEFVESMPLLGGCLRKFEAFELYAAGRNLRKVILRLLHKPSFGAATENL